MSDMPYIGETRLPNGLALLNALNLTPERLWSGSKIALPLSVVRLLLSVAISNLPFDETFYKDTYPDLADAYSSGSITNLRKHFNEQGYLEGRFGVRPNVDEKFYTQTYDDVAIAISRGQIGSGYEHYVGRGASEGRFANSEEMNLLKPWLEVIQRK
jgi:hypothetical protein